MLLTQRRHTAITSHHHTITPSTISNNTDNANDNDKALGASRRLPTNTLYY